MTPEELALLGALPGWAFAFVMVLARVAAAVMLLPAFGETEIPISVRAGIALTLSLLLLPLVAQAVPPVPGDVWRTALMIGAELLTGLWMGFLARLVVLSLPIAGQFISFMIGLANVLQNDVTTGQQITVLSRLFGVVAPVLVLASGAYMLPVSALYGSYGVLPPGGLPPVGDALQSVVSAVGQSISVALRLAAPFVLANVTWQVSIGLLARVAPTLHLFLVAMPGQILGGMLLFVLLGTAMLAVWDATVQAGYMQLPGLP